MQSSHGVYYVLVCFLGPCLLVHGVATLFVPEQKLQEPPVEGPDAKIVTQNDEFNVAGKVVFAIGLILGGAQWAMLASGRFL
jgi:hypothetical protein